MLKCIERKRAKECKSNDFKLQDKTEQEEDHREVLVDEAKWDEVECNEADSRQQGSDNKLIEGNADELELLNLHSDLVLRPLVQVE